MQPRLTPGLQSLHGTKALKSVPSGSQHCSSSGCWTREASFVFSVTASGRATCRLSVGQPRPRSALSPDCCSLGSDTKPLRRGEATRVWIDLANSPHVPLLRPVVEALEEQGDEVILTVRDHAQTVPLAQTLWPRVRVIGGASPGGRVSKARKIAQRANALRRLARTERPEVAFSHGSYAQLVAARLAGVPAVTMMDYEFQPANHLSFRLARKVIVPEVFPEGALRRFGASPKKVVRFPGFKEELYLAGFEPDTAVLQELGLSHDRVIAVFRPPPDGALYHRMTNRRFDEILAQARAREGVQVVLLPRTSAQRMGHGRDVIVPERPIDGASLLALADVVVGAGGTMNRESALLGRPTYTVFAGRLAAVDAALIEAGLLHDLQEPGSQPSFEKIAPTPANAKRSDQSAIMGAIIDAISHVRR
jgi:predicted glycosyltransferase